MSRLRGNLPAYLQQCFGICRRTFERWCARGDVPGAYRTRGGHWRVREPKWKFTIKKTKARPAGNTRRDQVRRAIDDYPFAPIQWDRLDTPFASKFLLAWNGISEEDLWHPEQCDSETLHVLWEEPLCYRRKFIEAINDPQCAPAIAGRIIRVNGRTVTPSALARALRVSVSTLYRRYDRQEINRVCQEPPIHVVASVGKKNRKPILVLSELEINSPSQPDSSGASA